MDSKQVADFIIYKAKPKLREAGFCNPKLGISWPSYPIVSKVYLTVNCFRPPARPQLFYLRLVEGTKRQMFILDIEDKDFAVWKDAALSKDTFGTESFMEYDIDKMPKCLVDFVTSRFKQALKTKGVGFDMFALGRHGDISLIEPSMSYEEAEIESDLAGFDFT